MIKLKEWFRLRTWKENENERERERMDSKNEKSLGFFFEQKSLGKGK